MLTTIASARAIGNGNITNYTYDLIRIIATDPLGKTTSSRKFPL